ncbi:MAG: hypothetical protein SOZ73_03650 [Campylobacter sp.]|nr:hypothetical protein [Campylobacter sp.]
MVAAVKTRLQDFLAIFCARSAALAVGRRSGAFKRVLRLFFKATAVGNSAKARL